MVFPLIDDRLIHGQVTLFWARSLGVDGILVANDAAAGDEIQKTALRLVVPPGLACHILPVAEAAQRLAALAGRRTLLLMTSPVDALAMLEGGAALGRVNLANLAARSGSVALTRHIHVLPQELEAVRRLRELGVAVTAMQLPHSPDDLAPGGEP